VELSNASGTVGVCLAGLGWYARSTATGRQQNPRVYGSAESSRFPRVGRYHLPVYIRKIAAAAALVSPLSIPSATSLISISFSEAATSGEPSHRRASACPRT
jgi:hypothetical protein